MLGSSILEVAIGLIFIYLLLSLICSGINEIIEAKLKNRATDLERGIRELFNEENGGAMVRKFYEHPLIRSLYSGSYEGRNGAITNLDYLKSTNLPSYIPAGNFAFALTDILLHDEPDAAAAAGEDQANVQNNVFAQPVAWANPQTNTLPMEVIREKISNNSNLNRNVQMALRTIVEQSGGDVNLMRRNVEAWFNSSMDRVSGWYTRRTKWIILFLGLFVAIGFNVNTVTIAKRLSNDATLRSMVVAQAEAYASRPEAEALEANFEKNRSELESLGLPMGWSNFVFYGPQSDGFQVWNHVLLNLIGWLLTAAAISMGAPFWFDLLNKFMVIRSTVKPHEKSQEESSEDRQQPQRPATTLSSTAATQTSAD